MAAPLFVVCSECGHIDRSVRANTKDEHRPWCSHRHDVEEHSTAVALHRHLVTEGIVLTLPPQVSIGDVFAVPSLRAALLLGLQVTYGGAPDHIEADAVVDPQPGGTNQHAVLLYDTVPGGTGYLAELSDAARLRRVLECALEKLRDCPCQHEERLACHRCLLPFTPHFLRELTARSAEVEHLETMIGTGEAWDVVDDRPQMQPDSESWLEQRFRAAFIELADRLGGAVTQVPGHAGNTVVVRLGSRSFKLQPQVLIPHAAPRRPPRPRRDRRRFEILRNRATSLTSSVVQTRPGPTSQRPTAVPAHVGGAGCPHGRPVRHAAVVDMAYGMDLSPEWRVIREEFGGEMEAIALIEHLSSAHVPAPDGEVGMEMGDGYAFDLVWIKQKITVQFNPQVDPKELPGWRILPPDGDIITEAWKGLTNG